MEPIMKELDELLKVMRPESVAHYTGAAYSTVLRWMRGGEISYMARKTIVDLYKKVSSGEISTNGVSRNRVSKKGVSRNRYLKESI